MARAHGTPTRSNPICRVVGYSRLTGRGRGRHLAASAKCVAQRRRTQVKAHAGRIVRIKGDGILVEFPSAVEAVASAVALQQAMAERNATLADAQRIELRIGINLGDIITSSDDIHGDGVNIACRLEPLAEPGGICISATVHEHVRAKLAYPFEDRGERTLKNIASPVADLCAWTGEHSELPRSEPRPDMQGSVGAGTSRLPWLIACCVRGRLAVVAISWPDRSKWLRCSSSFIQCSHDGRRIQGSDRRSATIHRGAAVHERGPRSGARILRRRNDRRLDHRSIAHSRRIRDRARPLPSPTRESRSTSGRSAATCRYATRCKAACVRVMDSVRINAQLVDTSNASQLWAERFDRRDCAACAECRTTSHSALPMR